MISLLWIIGLVVTTDPGKCMQSRYTETGLPNPYPHDIDCGGEQILKGTLKSPVIPTTDPPHYPNYCNCIWTIGSDYSGQYASLEIDFVHLDIEQNGLACSINDVGDYLQIASGISHTTYIKKEMCGNEVPEKIQRRVILPVQITFVSDLDHKAYRGFVLEYSVVPDAPTGDSGGQTLRIKQTATEEPEPPKANVGLIIGIMILVIVSMASAIYILCRRNKRLKLEARGPPPLELADIGNGMYAQENIYEELDVNSTLIRTESQDSIALQKEQAQNDSRIQNETRELPPLPNDA